MIDRTARSCTLSEDVIRHCVAVHPICCKSGGVVEIYNRCYTGKAPFRELFKTSVCMARGVHHRLIQSQFQIGNICSTARQKGWGRDLRWSDCWRLGRGGGGGRGGGCWCVSFSECGCIADTIILNLSTEVDLGDSKTRQRSRQRFSCRTQIFALSCLQNLESRSRSRTSTNH